VLSWLGEYPQISFAGHCPAIFSSPPLELCSLSQSEMTERTPSSSDFYRSPNPLSQEGFEPLFFTNITNLFLSLRRGFEPLSKSLANPSCVPLVASGKAERARDLIDSESWLSPSKFWYGSQAFAPSGFAMVFTPTTLSASRLPIRRPVFGVVDELSPFPRGGVSRDVK